MFEQISELADDRNCMVFVLIDEVCMSHIQVSVVVWVAISLGYKLRYQLVINACCCQAGTTIYRMAKWSILDVTSDMVSGHHKLYVVWSALQLYSCCQS